MNLLNLIEDTTTGYDNLRALIQAVQNSQDAVLSLAGEPITLTYPEARFMYGKYKAFVKAGRQEEFINDLGDPVRFDLHMRQLRQLLDKQKNFRGSVPGERGVMEEMSQENVGRANWDRMLRAWEENRPFAELEFGGSTLTVYRPQMWGIYQYMEPMNNDQRLKIVQTVFGDKIDLVMLIDSIRERGLISQQVPPASTRPQDTTTPDMFGDQQGTNEAVDQKKNSQEVDRNTAASAKVQRAFQLARARQPAARSDIEAFIKDEIEKSEAMEANLEQLQAENEKQNDQLTKLTQIVKQQSAEPVAAEPKAEPEKAKAEPEKKAKADKEPAKAEPEKAKAEPKKEPDSVGRAEKPAEPAKPVKPAKPDQEQPTTQVQIPEPSAEPSVSAEPEIIDLPPNVIPFPSVGRPEQQELPMTGTGGRTGTYNEAVTEESRELHVGDPVIISGNVEHQGKTGDVAGFGSDKHFVIVDLYNFGKHAFHASNVKYNDYADHDEDDYVAEMNTKLDRFNINRPQGGSPADRERFLTARDQLYRRLQNAATPGEKETIRMKISQIEGQAQSKGIKIRESGEFSRAGHNAINSVQDWAEKMRVMRELQKDINLMSDPEAKSAIDQRIGDLLKVGINQGYLKEASLSDKAMNLLRSLKKPAPAQSQTVAPMDPSKQADVDAWAQDFQKNVANRYGKQVVAPASQPAPIELNTPVKRGRGRPSNAEVQSQRDELQTVRRQIAQLDELIAMKEMIDKLFAKAQKVRGGIYPGLQSDIEDEEMYGVPTNDREFETLKAKYTKDLAALQQFLAMKKAMYREDQDRINESVSLVRLQQARRQLAGQGVAEAGKMTAYSKGKRDNKSFGKPLAPPYHKDSLDHAEYSRGWNEVEALRKKHGLSPYRKQGVAEGAGNIGNAIKSLYQKIYRAGDDEIEYFYNASPIFAQYWDEYEGDMDSIIAEVDPRELQIIFDELKSYADDANLAEGWIKLPNGNYRNMHTGVQQSKPPVKKKRGEKTGAEWDAIEKAKKDKEQGVSEGLADEFMKMAKDMGMNPRLRGTPDEERARTDAMLKQRAKDRANAPKPAPVSDEERADLEAKLKDLEAEFDPDYQYIDAPSGGEWHKHHDIAQRIGAIKQKLSQGKLDEFQMPNVSQWLTPGSQQQDTDDTPGNFSVVIAGTMPRDMQASDVKNAVEAILPNDYPRTNWPHDEASMRSPTHRLIQELVQRGQAVAKDGISSKDVADSIAVKFKKYKVPAYVEGTMSEARKANTKAARAGLAKREKSKPKVSDKEQAKKKEESDKLWDMLQAHIAQAEKEKGVSEEKVRLDPKCWTGKKIGNPKTKMKGGVRVNNCVPKE